MYPRHVHDAVALLLKLRFQCPALIDHQQTLLLHVGVATFLALGM